MSPSPSKQPVSIEPSNVNDGTFLQKIEAFISEKCREQNFGVSQLADMMHISTQQLNRKIHNVTGNTPSKLIADYRIGYARQLLLESDDTLSRIALKSGFYNQTSFNRCFYKHFQCSPSQFRKEFILNNKKVAESTSSVNSLTSLRELIKTKNWLIELAKTVLENVDNENLTVIQLAEKLCVSPSSLNRSLKKTLSMTPRDFIKKLRLLYACELLSNKIGSISDVAYRAGFFDPAHLSRSFKAVFGYPPSDFHIHSESELTISWISMIQNDK
ncbi:MAG: AraC family transcriptional regulator [Bacteroidetes bacterium]|nr:AraC family transcriptional regulator [Bacteroidota bacterium]